MSDLSRDQVVEWLSNLTVLQLSDITKELEGKWGVSAAAAIAVAPGIAATGADSAPAEAKTEFDVILSQVGDKKIQVIKAVRTITNLGLKEAKALVEEAPSSVKAGVGKEEAEQIKSTLEEAGASVELK